jgi:hypothetical protein
VKRVKDWTTTACHVYKSKYLKALSIACCIMQCKDAIVQFLLWQNLNNVMLENGISNVNFKKFMADNAKANWNVVWKIYGFGDSVVPMENWERTCLFY